MKIKFNLFERVAGLFVLSAIIGSVAVTVGVAMKKGWFDSKIRFETTLPSADGIHSGTVVQIAGLRVGAVEEVELKSNDNIRVAFDVTQRYVNQIREDSRIQVIRPFVIGEKVLEISVGSENLAQLQPGAHIDTMASFDIMDLVSGKKLGPFLGSLERFSENLRVLGEAFTDPRRTKALVKTFDQINPLVKNLNNMSLEVVKLSKELNRVLPQMARETPDMGQQIGQIVRNLNILTAEFQKLTPAIATIAPELPRTTRRAVEALDETVVLLKAMQKSFLLRGKVEEVREEESKRQPASAK